MTTPLDNPRSSCHTPLEVEGEAIPVYVVHMYRREDRPGRPWVLFWYDPPSQTRRRRFRTIGPMSRRQADKHRRLWQCELNGFREEPTGDLTWRRFVAECLRARAVELAPASLAVLRQVLDRFGRAARPRLLGHVGRRMVDEYRLARIAETSVATARKDIRTLRSAFSWAVYVGYIDANPCDGIRWGGRPHRRVKAVLSSEETRRFLAALGGEPAWIEASLRLAALWGPRTGDLVRIRPEDVDLAERWIWLRGRGRDAPKDRRDRAVPLDEHTGGLVQELMAREDGVGLLWGPRREPFTCAGGKNGYRKALVGAARRILATVGHADVDQPIQMLRRTAETNLRRRGVAREVIARILGHSAGVGDRFYDGRTLEELLRGAEVRTRMGGSAAQPERNQTPPTDAAPRANLGEDR